MRKTWIVLAVVLLGGAPLAAQPAQWSVGRVGDAQAARANAPPGTTYILLVAQPPANHAAPPAALAPPVVNLPAPVVNAPVVNAPAGPPAVIGAPVTAPCASGNCASGNCAARREIDWDRLREWLCYRSPRGGCSKKGSCGCNCSVPLYAYYLHECREGRKHELPPCVADAQKEPPHVFRRMLGDARSLFRTNWRASDPACVGGKCQDEGGTQPGVGFGAGHRYGALPTGHGH